MTTPVTPQFALPYLEEGAPFYLIRQRVQAAMEQLDAVLATKAVTPPGAADLLAVSNRVTTLETDQAAEDARGNAVAVTFSTGFGQFVASPYGELLKTWKTATGEVRVAGLVQGSTALAASATPAVMFTLPVGYRPAIRLLRSCWYQVSLNPPVLFRVQIDTNGQVGLVAHTATAATWWYQFDLTFRTVNT